MNHMLFIVVVLFFLVNNVRPLENGLARTPPMGWMSWGYYMCADKCKKDSNKCLNESLIMSVADAFYKEGYLEAGYEYIIIDDCWSERQRDWEGRLVPNYERFPRGMKFLADYIHARGLKFGMYMNIAETTCMQYPGSRGYFSRDAQTFADWDVDYIKVDGCFVKEPYLDTAYIDLGYQLNRTGRPMVYSCSWPYYKKYIVKNPLDYNKVVPVCNLWRNFHDVAPNWGNVAWIMKDYEDNAGYYKQFHGPGHWNDPDMLVLGTGSLTPGRARIQTVVWAMWSAPWLISCDMKRLRPDERNLLLNLNLLAVAQDKLGIMATPFKDTTGSLTTWVKPHLPLKGDQYYSYSFAVVNTGPLPRPLALKPSRYGLNSSDLYTVLDVLSEKFLRNVSIHDTLSVMVEPDDVVMYTLFPL